MEHATDPSQDFPRFTLLPVYELLKYVYRGIKLHKAVRDLLRQIPVFHRDHLALLAGWCNLPTNTPDSISKAQLSRLLYTFPRVIYN